MELRSETLLAALPASFPFYHLGEVRAAEGMAADQSAFDLSRSIGIGFSLLGDARGLILMVFNSTLDLSIYTEIGNTIASKIATQLSVSDGVGVMISPPRSLTPDQVARLMSGRTPLIQKTYTHVHRDDAVPILVWALPEIQEELGNA
jgi:hypothetical protein